MKIAYLAAGAADMVCGTCLRDNTLAAALIELGEDVLLVPTYTPLRTDEPSVSQRRVFMGGVNLYLQHRWRPFRRLPQWMARLLDHPALLGLLAGRAGSVDPAGLGDLTVAMLQGEAGPLRKAVDRLARWLGDEVQPDVVHLSNSMMLGLARPVAQATGAPIVCSLSGEDLFLEKLGAPYYQQARELLRERAAEVDGFVATNRYYADFMADYLSVPRQRVHVIPHGLQLAGHGTRTSQPSDAVRRIGFLSRICEEKGLHLLVEACTHLAEQADLPPFELHVAGYLGRGERSYWKQLASQLAAGPMTGRWVFHGEVSREEKIAFLQSLDLLSLPSLHPESKGLPALEAWANAVPAVLPDHGAFTEMVTDTGGGLLFQPNDIADLTDKLAALLADPDHATRLGQAGQQAVHTRHHAPAMARQMQELYRRLQ